MWGSDVAVVSGNIVLTIEDKEVAAGQWGLVRAHCGRKAETRET